MHELLAQIIVQDRLREAERRGATTRHVPRRARRRWRLQSPIVLERPAARATTRPCV